MVVFTHLIKDLRCFIFMKNRVIFFPDVNMIFSDTQKYRDIFLRDNVPLAENRIFCDTFNIWFLLLINAGTLLASVLMLIGPSYLITKINPASSMRYE